MEKLRYEVDPQNRLVIKKTGLWGFRRVLEGYFKTTENNRLAYHIKAPVPADIKAPYQVKLKGKWALNEHHDLRFTLDKWSRQTFGDQLTIQGDIIDAQKNSLLFAVTTRTKENTQSTYILKLEGSWQADKYNRLTFRVNKERGRYDILALEGAWEIGPRYQIIYKYQKEHLARKIKKIHTLALEGYWEIKDKARISYVIDRNSDSVLNFKTSLGIFKDDYIKYELGIGRRQRLKPLRRTIILFGSWKIKKDRGLVFEIEYGRRKVQAMAFGAEARLTDKDTVLFNLKNSFNREIGAQLELGHKIFKGEGQTFLHLLKSRQESAILVGAGWRW